MADTKVSDLASATPISTDLVYLVDDPGGTPLSKNATVADLLAVSHNAATVTVADAGGDTTTFPMLAGSATGDLGPLTDAGLTYNATTNALTATSFVGALTGNADTATAADTVTVDATTTDTTTFVMLAESASGDLEPQTDAGLTYDASANDLTIGNDVLVGGDIIGDSTNLTIYGGDTAGDTLHLRGSSSDISDPVHIDSPIIKHSTDTTFDSEDVSGHYLIGDGGPLAFGDPTTPVYTIDDTNGGLLNLGPSVNAVGCLAVYEWENNPNAFGMMNLFQNASKQRPVSGESRAFPGATVFADQMIFSANDTAGSTLASHASYRSSPTYKRDSSPGTITVTSLTGYQSALTVSTGATVTTRYGFSAAGATVTGTLTNQVGYVVNLTGTGTNNTSVLIGTATPPSGDWAIYNTSADDNFIEGEIFLNTDTGPSISAGSGAASGTPTLGSIYLRSGGGSGVDGIYVYDTVGGPGWSGPLT
jgi:hypothetical protein